MARMRFKRLIAILCTVSIFALVSSGCSVNLEIDKSGEVDTDNSSIATSTATRTQEEFDSSNDTQESSGLGVTMKVDEDGNMNISRIDKSNKNKAMADDGTWTIFIYLCGSDLESANGLATNDMIEMMEASTGSNVRFIVQTDGSYEWQNNLVDSDSICRYEISEGNITELDFQPSANMGSSDTLSSFLIWGVQEFPAAKMGVILWNHGGGSITGVCFDEKNEYDSLSLKELDLALSATYEYMTDQFEFIGFDACLMGTIETANILATYSRFMFGSEEIEPGYGWNYTDIGDYLGSNPYADGAALGKVVADSFYEDCCAINSQSGATFSIIDLSAIDDLVMAFNNFAKNLYESADDSSVLSNVVRSINSGDNFGGNNKAEGYTNMVDLLAIVDAGAQYTKEAEAVYAAVDSAVVYMVNGSDHSNACGLSTYYPLELQGSSEIQTFSSVSVSPYYLAFIERTLYGNINTGDMSDYDNTALINNWNDEESTDDYWEYYDDYGQTGDSPLVEYYDVPQLLDDGSFAFSLTDESLEYVASVQAVVYLMSDDMEDIIELGYSVDIIPDWEVGVFYDNFDGYWFALPDGQPLAVYIVYEGYGYDVYTSPVMINGEETNLRITHDYVNNTVMIDGVWDGISDSGMSSRNVYELGRGDSIIPIYYAYAIDTDDEYYYYGSKYVFDGKPEIYFDLLFDGEYLYAFMIEDIFGDYALTPFVNYTVEGNYVYYSEELY